MIPSTTAFSDENFELETQPTYTYKLNMETDRIRGCVEGLEAMKQVIYKMLLTERYQYIIYSWDYGIETLDLYGEPATFVCPELERRISEALLVDERIESVSDFEFDTSQKGVVHVAFTAHTIFGDAEVESEVNI